MADGEWRGHATGSHTGRWSDERAPITLLTYLTFYLLSQQLVLPCTFEIFGVLVAMLGSVLFSLESAVCHQFDV